MLQKIFDLIKSLNSNSKPGQIANSFCLGLLIGFMPKDNLFWYVLVIFFAFVRINKAGYWLMMALGTALARLLDPMFDVLGYAVLTFKPFEPFFSWIIEAPFLSFTKLNNSIVCGSFVFALAVYAPLFVLAFYFIKLWRKYITPKINGSHFVKVFYKIPLIAKLAGKAVSKDGAK